MNPLGLPAERRLSIHAVLLGATSAFLAHIIDSRPEGEQHPVYRAVRAQIRALGELLWLGGGRPALDEAVAAVRLALGDGGVAVMGALWALIGVRRVPTLCGRPI
jgi:hypothetical protein